MTFDMVQEILGVHLHHAQQRHRRDLTQTAQREIDDVLGGPLHEWEILTRSTAETDAIEDLDECWVAAVAGNALRARLDAIERGQIAREVDGTDVLVEDDEAAGTEHSPDLRHGVEIDGVVQMLRRQRSGRDATGLHAAELVSVAHATPDVIEERTHRDTHRGLHEPDVLQRSLHGHHLGAGACRRPDLGVPLTALVDDSGDVGEGLRVVEDGGTLP
jgi:hypothetical protein